MLTRRIAEAAPPDLDPAIAAVALVAMFERLNYYALAGQVRAERGDIVDTLALVTQRALFGSDQSEPSTRAWRSPSSETGPA